MCQLLQFRSFLSGALQALVETGTARNLTKSSEMLVKETNFTTTRSARVQRRMHPRTRARLSFAVANRRANQVIKYNQHQIQFDSEAHGWALCGPRQLSRKISRLEGVAKNLTPDDPRHVLLAQIKYYRDLIEGPTSAGRRQPSPPGSGRGCS